MVHGDPYATAFLKAHPHYQAVYVRDDQGERRMGFPAPLAMAFLTWMGSQKILPRGVLQTLRHRIRREVKVATPTPAHGVDDDLVC